VYFIGVFRVFGFVRRVQLLFLVLFISFYAWRWAFDAKPALNTIASKGYVPLVKRGLTSLRGYGAR
jgi:hypothetical protein